MAGGWPSKTFSLLMLAPHLDRTRDSTLSRSIDCTFPLNLHPRGTSESEYENTGNRRYSLMDKSLICHDTKCFEM